MPEKVFAFCGIADPNSFKLSLKNNRIIPTGFRAFRDHEPYSNLTICKLEDEIDKLHIKNIVTTEKDIVKLSDGFIKKYNVFTVRIRHVIENDGKFIQKLIEQIKRNDK